MFKLLTKIPAKKFFMLLDSGSIEEHLVDPMKSSDLLLVDGTFWTDTEMIDNGLSKKLAEKWGTIHKVGPGE